MMARADIEDALVRLEQVHKQLGELSTGAEPGWEKQYLQARRTLQEQINRLCQADAQLNLSHEDSRRFRDAFGKFRTATALHQADWPVVEIDRQNPAYSQSAANVGQTYQQFMTVMRALMQR
ncbi:hypothetical protein [Sphingobium chungangianum]